MKKLLCVLSIVCVMLCSCSGEAKVTGDDTKLQSRLANMAELGKNVFIADVLSVETADTATQKYNITLSKYTKYKVNITRDLDGFTPTGEALVYCLGTGEEFPERFSLKKGETYILDAQPWVIGDKLVYLLSQFTIAFPRVDTANMVTVAQSESESLSCGTVENYIKTYKDEAEKLGREPYGLYSAYLAFAEEISTKTGDTEFYDRMGYEVRPTAEETELSHKTAETAYELLKSRGGNKSMTDDEARSAITEYIQSVGY